MNDEPKLSRLAVLQMNTQAIVNAVLGGIFLFGLACWGLWKLAGWLWSLL